VSNTGYEADSASLVTITLPAAPIAGDVVSVTGLGSGGWRIAQNAGQQIVVRGLPTASGVDTTTLGATGSLSGSQNDAVELQFVGGGKFIVLTYTNYSGAFVPN
jgi:hypothetical protein